MRPSTERAVRDGQIEIGLVGGEKDSQVEKTCGSGRTLGVGWKGETACAGDIDCEGEVVCRGRDLGKGLRIGRRGELTSAEGCER